MASSAVSLPIGSALIISLLGLAVLVVLAWVLFAVRRRRLVSNTSIALKQLSELNSRVRRSVPRLPPIRHTFRATANSKAKFDRFDLPALISRSLLDSEPWFEQEIGIRLEATRLYGTYHHDFEALAYRWLGKSGHPSVTEERFAVIEQKTFRRRKLAYPLPKARVKSTVSYTSPKGKNSYSRRHEWNFDQLCEGFRAAQAARAHQSTQEFLRQRERSLMTDRLRVTILRRDGSRCKMCGASAAAGATLHIDHITPVSLGGRTVPENLQTLCQSCNLGKSNTFIG